MRTHSKYLKYEEAREYVRSLNLKSGKEWQVFSKSGKLPPNIPYNPYNSYMNKGWVNWEDFLGNSDKFLRFEEAREYARSLNLKSMKEWRELSKSGKLPSNVPGGPNWVYRDNGWKGWGDFLGTNNVSTSKREYLSYEGAREYVHSLNFNSVEEWREFAKTGTLPSNIPCNPYQLYVGRGWTNWEDFLGNVERKASRFLRFEEAREYARSLNLKSMKEWRELSKSGKRPSNIPSNSYRSYMDKGWAGWKDFLGNEKSQSKDTKPKSQTYAY